MRRRKHQRDLICSFALSIFLLLPSVVFADDHGNTYSAATPISTDGTLYDGEIEIGGDVDYFSFGAASGYRYVILTSQLGVGCDTVIRLYDTDGTTELDMDDDGATEHLASRIVWQANSPGTYYVRVEHYNDTGTGTYKISITGTRLAGICEACSTDNDCESGNCGVNLETGDRRCIPAGAAEYGCPVGEVDAGGGGCFIATVICDLSMELGFSPVVTLALAVLLVSLVGIGAGISLKRRRARPKA